jgi:hypothetical protein
VEHWKLRPVLACQLDLWCNMPEHKLLIGFFVLKYPMYRVTILPILAAAWIRTSCMMHDTHLLSLWAQAC